MTVNKKILIIDDEPDLAQMVAFQFKSQGFEVREASDGVVALAMVHDFQPDLIILDINMPRMGGIEFYSKICNRGGQPLYPVLVLTARANIQSLFHDLHIDGFMIKPFEIEQLTHEASVIIRKKEEQRVNGKRSKEEHKVCVIDQDQSTFEGISHLFLNANYTVIPARNGTMAIERMMKDVPDMAIVNLGLSDIPGDIVIYRLSQMSKTMDVKFILYTSKSAEHDRKVMERISLKSGIWTFVEYDSLNDILNTAHEILQ